MANKATTAAMTADPMSTPCIIISTLELSVTPEEEHTPRTCINSRKLESARGGVDSTGDGRASNSAECNHGETHPDAHSDVLRPAHVNERRGKHGDVDSRGKTVCCLSLEQ